MVMVGAMVALQSQINGDLAVRLGDGLRAGAAAAVISFATGLLLLVLLVALLPGPRAGVGQVVHAARRGRLRMHQLLGGAAGAYLVATQGLTVGTIGVAIFIVAIVAGQTTSGLVVDRLGLGPSGRQAITAGRVFGATLTLAAVGISVSGRLAGGTMAAGVLALALLPLVAGAGTAWQQAMNGHVSRISHPLTAALNNFVVGTVLLVGFLMVALLFPGDLAGPPSAWWLYLGGPIAAVFIAASAALVGVHGVLVFGLCVVAGQVVTSVLIDLVVADTALGVATVGGAGLALAGVVVGALASRRA